MSGNLPAFLLARYAEDESKARREVGRFDVVLLGPFDPAHILADIAAKRRIVETYESREAQASKHLAVAAHATGLLLALRCLALPYADHEDFREEWLP